MDKLQPLIKHRFWILAGLILPLAMYGYYSANNALKAETASRESALQQVKSGVSKGFEPNENYRDNLAGINTLYSKYVDEAIVDLWNHQQERMTWPKLVQQHVPEQFLGKFPSNAEAAYKQEYPKVMEALRQHAEPVMPDPRQQGAMVPGARPLPPFEYPWKQKIVLAAALPEARWGSVLGITSQEMWNAQIDVWLTRLLLDAIRNINDDKENINDAIVRRLDRLSLMGGNGTPGAGGDPSMMGDEYGSEYGDYGMDAYGGDMGMEGGMPGSPGMIAPIVSSIGFPPEQEFGPAVDMGAGGGMEGTPVMAVEKRYIAENESAPFLERGFYLSVIILQNKVPDFLVELANAPWPTRVVRFNLGANPYRTEVTLSPVMQPTNPMFNPLASMGNPMGNPGMMPMMGARPEMPSFGTNMNSGLSQNLPYWAVSALEHPDLVRLDLAGVITIYRQPVESLAAVRAANALPDAATVDPENADPATGVENAEGALTTDPTKNVLPEVDPNAAPEGEGAATESSPGEAAAP